MKLNKITALLLIVAMLSVLALTACGSSGDSGSTPAADTPQQESVAIPEEGAAGAPTFGDVNAVEKVEGTESTFPLTLYGQTIDVTITTNEAGEFYLTYELVAGSPIAANGTMADAENWTVNDSNFSDIDLVLPDLIAAYNAAQ